MDLYGVMEESVKYKHYDFKHVWDVCFKQVWEQKCNHTLHNEYAS